MVPQWTSRGEKFIDRCFGEERRGKWVPRRWYQRGRDEERRSTPIEVGDANSGLVSFLRER